jgi:membrane protein implicated in regulation of membrane protease activity
MVFGGDVLEFVYLVCFFLGLGFALISGLLGGVFSGGAEAHIDAGGIHGAPTEGPVHFPLLSPVTLAMFISTFGGIGFLLKRMSTMPVAVQVPIAAASGLILGGGVSWFFYRIMRSLESTSHIRADEAVGQEAEVTVPIPKDGLGEIAFTAKGSRTSSPARSADGLEIAARTTVKIVKLVGSTYHVQKS